MKAVYSRRRMLKGGVLAALGMQVARAGAAVVKHELPSPDLSDLAGRVTLVRRDAWTAIRPKPWRLRGATAYDRITVHHAGAVISRGLDRDAVRERIENVLLEHQNRNYGDIGYHFLVDFAGRVWEGRSLAYEGAHTLGQNERNVGIALLGNFEQQEPGREQLDALAGLVDGIRERYRIKRHRVYGHRDLAHSLCPGTRLYAEIVKLRSWEAHA
jgi:hypothetical protein